MALSVTVNGNEASPAAMAAFLGVVASPLAPNLRAQLDLPEGMGLSVDMVAKDSPADKAGIKQYDVLKKFNDQMLCAQEQLAVLVKAAGKGTKVTLVLLRGGKEQTMDVTLGERVAPETGKAQFSVNGVPGVSIEVHDLEKMLKEGITENLPAEILKFLQPNNAEKGGSADIQQKMEQSRKKFEQRRKDLDAKLEDELKKPQADTSPDKNSATAHAQVFSIYPDAQSQSMVTFSDADGSMEINETKGKRTVKIKDHSGQEIYSGDLNTEADHNAVPEKFRDKIKDIETRIKVGGK